MDQIGHHLDLSAAATCAQNSDLQTDNRPLHKCQRTDRKTQSNRQAQKDTCKTQTMDTDRQEVRCTDRDKGASQCSRHRNQILLSDGLQGYSKNKDKPTRHLTNQTNQLNYGSAQTVVQVQTKVDIEYHKKPTIFNVNHSQVHLHIIQLSQ